MTPYLFHISTALYLPHHFCILSLQLLLCPAIRSFVSPRLARHCPSATECGVQLSVTAHSAAFAHLRLHVPAQLLARPHQPQQDWVRFHSSIQFLTIFISVSLCRSLLLHHHPLFVSHLHVLPLPYYSTRGTLFKLARVGERLSPLVSISLIIMAFRVLWAD